MIGIQGITGLSGIQGTSGIIGVVGISGQESGGAGPLPTIYANYPLFNNPNSTVGSSVIHRSGLSFKTVSLTDRVEGIAENVAAVFPNHLLADGSSSNGLLVEKQQTTQIPTDMSVWDDLSGSTVTYNDATKENRWLFTGGNVGHRAFANSAVTDGLDYTLSLEVKKGESQFLQIVGSSGFAGTSTAGSPPIVINYDLLNGLTNAQASASTLKGFQIIDLGDYVRVIATMECNSTKVDGRFIVTKCDSLTDSRLPASPDSGAFTVKYPNFVQASEISSPIDNPSAASATRGADVYTLPTPFPSTDIEFNIDAIPLQDGSQLEIDDGAFVGNSSGSFASGTAWSNGLSTQSDFDDAYLLIALGVDGVSGKYENLVTDKLIGSTCEGYEVTSAPNSNVVRIVGLSALTYAEVQAIFEYPNKWTFDFTNSALTTAELIELRAAVGDAVDLMAIPDSTQTYQTSLQYFRDTIAFTHGDDVITAAISAEYGQEFSISAAISATELLLNGETVTRNDLRNNDFAISGNLDGGNTLITSIQVKEYQEL